LKAYLPHDSIVVGYKTRTDLQYITKRPEFFFLNVPISIKEDFPSNFNEIANDNVGDWTLCDLRTSRLWQWDRWLKQENDVDCRIYTSQSKYNLNVLEDSSVYTIISSPVDHIVRQYEHCSLSGKMPSFQNWIETWHEISQLRRDGKSNDSDYRELLHELKDTFHCFNPMNLQSDYLGFDGDLDKLENRYEVIGLNDQYERSLCVIFIHASDGIVPDECDCSSTSGRRLSSKGNILQRRRDTMSATPEQINMINSIAKVDKILYSHASNVFEQTVKKVEREHRFHMCKFSGDRPSDHAGDDDDSDDEIIQPNNNPPEKYFVHIPKTAGTSAFARFNDITRRNIGHDYMLCNLGAAPLQKYRGWMTEYKGRNCRVHMSESPYRENILEESSVYTIVRNPQEHVVSQYFHCVESTRHKKKDHMPTLTEWLAHWVEGLNRINASQNKKKTNKKVMAEMRDYNCYNPINLQSFYMDFDGSDKSLSRLDDNYEVIGVSTRFEQTVCLVFIHASDGVIPDECNCSSSHRRLGKVISHGVKHHAADFETDSEQEAFINKLTEVDTVLYDYVNDVLFDKQIERLEKQYNFNLCENPVAPPPLPKKKKRKEHNNNKALATTVNDTTNENDGKLTAPPRRYFIHIPKVAGTSAFASFNDMASQYADYKWMLCNHGSAQLKRWDNWYPHFNGSRKCRVHMAESGYNADILESSSVYAFVRQPKEHVLSQFFHCTESHRRDDNEKNAMPSLDRWLDEWTEGKRTLERDLSARGKVVGTMRYKYHCYNPINMQSDFLGLTEDNDVNLDLLDEQMEVIGLSTRFEESMCMIFIHASDGIIPNECDCSLPHRRLNTQVSHGVLHHGSTYKPTNKQLKKINELTNLDQKLYAYVKDDLFDKQVERFEKKYNFKLCENPARL